MEKKSTIENMSNADPEEARQKIGNGNPKRKDRDDSKPSSPQQRKLYYPTGHMEITSSKIGTSQIESESALPSNSRILEEDGMLDSARAEMDEVREENERLKKYLERVTRDYKTLEVQLFDIVKQDDQNSRPIMNNNNNNVEEPDQLVSLSLGRVSGSCSSLRKDDEKGKISYDSRNCKEKNDDEDREGGLGLSLDFGRFESANKLSGIAEPSKNNTSPENSSGDRTVRSGEDEASPQNPAKKARVCVRARCDTPTMNDGCQWRKYGQKIAKGNPCPRAYYRCTVAPACPVRKQVQRCADDMSILITTYEGTHNHPLPISATAMASTTSAAASMLLSGSSTSGSGQGLPTTAATTATTDLHGLNFYISDPSRPKQFYLPSSSPITPSPTHPTITLDLTSSSTPSYLKPFSSSNNSNYYNAMTRYNSLPSSASLNFSSWGSSSSSTGLLSHGATNYHQLFNKTNNPYPQESFLHHLPKTNPQDSIAAAATKAITADPSFQSALTAALKSIIGGNVGVGSPTTSALGNYLRESRLSGEYQKDGAGSIFGPTVACGSSYLNKSGHSTTSSNLQSPGSIFLQSNPISLPFSSSRPQNSAATSPGDNRDVKRI